MAKKARKKRIKVVYRQAEYDPAEAQEHLDRAFEVVFEEMLKTANGLKNQSCRVTNNPLLD